MSRDITCIRMWGWAAPTGGIIFQHLFYIILITLVSGQPAENFVETFWQLAMGTLFPHGLNNFPVLAYIMNFSKI